MDAAFDAVYREYGGAVHGYLSRLTGDPSLAEELAQETFVRFLRHRSSIHGVNGTLGAWLFKVATNLARDRARRRRQEPLPAEEARAPAGGDGLSAAEAQEVGERVRREVDRLPPELRGAFLLRAHHELPYEKVAAALGVCERTAKERFRMAREILAHRLSPLLDEDRR